MHNNRPSTLPVLLTVPEAAAELRVCRATLYNLIAAGQLRRVRIGRSVRIPSAQVLDLIERGTE